MKVVIDIETSRPPVDHWRYLKGLSSGDGEQEVCPTEWLKEYEKSSFDATYSQIICIGLLILDEASTPLESLAWCGDDEKQILESFWSKMSSLSPNQIIAHNGLGFDLPFLQKRSVIQRVRPAFSIPLAKFRTSPVFDTMAVWANWDARSYVALDVLARALQVEPKSGCGSDVAGQWAQRKFLELARYCLQDTVVTYYCFCRMNFIELHSCIEIRETAIISIYEASDIMTADPVATLR